MGTTALPTTSGDWEETAQAVRDHSLDYDLHRTEFIVHAITED